MDYALTNLGTREFEHLAQALALSVLGGGVGVFGDGPDGGREATWSGAVAFPHGESAGHWDGPGVLQAKFRQRPLGEGRDVDWVKGQFEGELKTWADPKSKRRQPSAVPDYFIFATNVVLTPANGGGIETIDNLIAGYADQLGLKGWDVWHYDKLCRMLDTRPSLLRTFAALITPSTLIAQLLDQLGGTAATVGPTLAAHAAKELTAKQWIRLSEVGEANNQKITLGDVAIDLPARTDQGKSLPGVVGHLMERGDTLLRPSCGRGQQPRVAIVAGPGQGKSTLGQLICQAYRVALLDGLPEHQLGPAAARLHGTLKVQLAEIGLPIPRLLRWPIKIDLSDFAEYVAGGEDYSLLSYLATVVSTRSPDKVTAGDLREWLGAWPWLLVLDGLDEVPVTATREAFTDKLNDFLVDAGVADADLLIIATTRPQGYDDEFSEFEHITLEPLDPDDAYRFAERLSAVRHGDDVDLAAKVLVRLRAAAEDPATARLMKSPLQVTIMSLILERRESAPQDRYALFKEYYDTIYKREAAKPGFLAKLLSKEQPHVDWLHQRAGMVLHTRAEHTPEAHAALSRDELRDMAVERYLTEGYDKAKASAQAEQLLTATTDRLVLLTSIGGLLGFEVRSLQEFMAARALSTGRPEQVLTGLSALARSSHWRNTWLFAAGRLFSQEDLRSDIVALLTDLDADPHDVTTGIVLPGAQLALDMLDEDIAINSPLYRRRFVHQALRLLDIVPGQNLIQLAAALRRACDADPDTKTIVEANLQRTASAWPTRLTAMAIWSRWSRTSGPLAANARQHLYRAVEATEEHRLAAEIALAWFVPSDPLRALLARADTVAADTRTLAAIVKQSAVAHGADPIMLNRLNPLLEALADVRPHERVRTAAGQAMPHISVPGTALDDPEIRDLLTLITYSLAGDDWVAASDLRRILTVWSLRQPADGFLLNEPANGKQ